MKPQIKAMNEPEAAGLCCTNCGSTEVRASPVRSAFWHDDRLVVVEGIPAFVCGHCGEQFYEDSTAIGLDRLRGGGFPPHEAVRTLEVPVFAFGEAPAIRKVA
jgi:YgiT-type zinc finger domain-containing protein